MRSVTASEASRPIKEQGFGKQVPRREMGQKVSASSGLLKGKGCSHLCR